MEGLVLRDKCVLQIVVFRAEILVPRCGGSQVLCGPQRLPLPSQGTSHFLPSLVVFCSGFPGGPNRKEFTCKAADAGDQACMAWQSTPVFLPGKSHGQRSLASLTETSLRAGTIFISCLHSPLGIAECFPFLKSSISICRMNGILNKYLQNE